MRTICIFANTFFSGQDVGGGDIRFVEIMKRIPRFRKVVITTNAGERFCKRYGLNATYLRTTGFQPRWNIILTYLKGTLGALRLNFNINRKDILYVTSDLLPDVLPALVQKLRNGDVKWIQIVHHLIPHPLGRKGSLLPNIISYYAQKLSFFMIKHMGDVIITVNPLVAKELEQRGFDKKKIKLNSNGISLKYFHNIKPTKGNAYDAIFLGRLHPSKGVLDLVKIWKEVSKGEPNAKLGIIGHGDKRVIDDLTQGIMDNGLKNSEVLGYLEKNEAFRIIKSSKVFVFPSYEEGWGISICEAMACGLPVVAWDLSIYLKVFTKGMIRVPIGDVKEFAASVLSLLNDNSLYRRMKKDAIEVASVYDWDKIAVAEQELICSHSIHCCYSSKKHLGRQCPTSKKE